MKLNAFVAASLAAALLACGIARADTPIYKWVDDKGQVHYSTDPHNESAKQLNIQNNGTLPNPSTAPAAASAVATPSSPADDARLVQPQPADSPECKAGRDRLFKYLHADNLYSVDEKGNKVTMSAADKLKALDESRDYVRQACGGGA